jgi:HlyD family secretion protein
MRVVLLSVLALTMVACAKQDADELVGTLERDRLELIAEANEPIIEIAVKEGDVVAAGDRLLKLDSMSAQARLDEASAARSLAERRLAELIKGPRSQEILEARAALAGAVSVERTASNEFARVDDLVARRLLSQSQLDAARSQRDSAVAANKQASARLNLLLEGSRRESIEQAEAQLRGASAALTQVETSLARHSIVAPRPGRIEALPFKLGERPPAGAPVIIMLGDGAPYARVYIPEPRRVQFAAGTQVSVRVDGSERAYAGVVRFISASAQFTPYYALTQDDRSQLSYLAEIDLPKADATSLPSGIPVQVRLSQP